MGAMGGMPPMGAPPGGDMASPPPGGSQDAGQGPVKTAGEDWVAFLDRILPLLDGDKDDAEKVVGDKDDEGQGDNTQNTPAPQGQDAQAMPGMPQDPGMPPDQGMPGMPPAPGGAPLLPGM